MKLGVVGLPNVGKSTLFNAITNAGAQGGKLPCHSGTQFVVIVEIILLFLPLDVLFCLICGPAGTVLMTAGRMIRAACLTGKHGKTPFSTHAVI